MVDILRTALSGLTAAQRSLATTGHNIANVNNPDFNRQRVDLNAASAQKEGNGYVGRGVQVAGVSRIYDDLVTGQVRNHVTQHGQLETLDGLTRELGRLVGGGEANLSPAMEQFFAAAQDVASDPASIPARQVLLGSAESLAVRFQDMDARMTELRQSVNDGVKDTVNEINGLARAIGAVNEDIVLAQGGGAVPNDLLDQRDGLLKELAGKVAIRVNPGDQGMVNVFIGKGQPLVVGQRPSQLVVGPSAADAEDIAIRIQGQDQNTDLSPELVGGRIGGLLEFRDEVLDPARNQLGLLALGLGQTVNDVQQQGYDLLAAGPADTGEPLFEIAAPVVKGNLGNSNDPGTVNVTLDNAGELTASDYEVVWTGGVPAGQYRLYRLEDGQEFAAVVDAAGTHTFDADGMTITVGGGTPQPGDRFQIQPTRDGARDMALAFTDPRKIAAAEIVGAPGDNRKALELANLQTRNTLLDGTSDYQGVYTRMVAQVGAQSNRIDNALTAQTALLEQAEQARSGVSGVNLDEEAANLMRFQQSYQASAQLIQAADSLFSTLLDAVRR